MGFFATEQTGIAVNGILYSHTSEGAHQLGLQLYGITVCAGWSAVVSYLLLQFLDYTVGLRVTEKEEDDGLDVSLHGETIILKRDDAELQRIHTVTTTRARASSPEGSDGSGSSSGSGGRGTPVPVRSDVGTSAELYEQAAGRALEPLQHTRSHSVHHQRREAVGLSTPSEAELTEYKTGEMPLALQHDTASKTVTFA